MAENDDIYDFADVQKKYQKYLKCGDCEFCFADQDGYVCADKYYGKHMTEEEVQNNPICEGEDISVSSYMELEEEMHEDKKNGRKFN
jgi:hypothetical protein